ncbi:unnamed protein product [Rotaria sp. Silwood1]|nr:unnamed protein product [Rotaria sp. Silwood1]CAF0766470.1 unnamed protein product [Rotaria sp. Silwood1]CAF0784285.1 unnamed protein product [Rotaria sp. Silwood1]CAF3320241.1 unnamed protein product [Rotaria sp. Silwood1]CAF3336394.1 unnamed protein product [Rotaria sp. Silwood1]
MTSSRIPLYRVKGTHYECAYTIGTLTREKIQHRIADDLAELSVLFKFIQTEYGLRLHRNFIETIRSLYPWYWDEICGIADGSGIPLEQLLVLNFLNETRTAYKLLEEAQQLDLRSEKFLNENGEKGCTTVLLNRKDTNTFSLLHNEDHAAALYFTGYVVEADIQSSEYDDGKRQSPNEKFIAYCYAGVIPGNAFGANRHGFAFSLNGLYPDCVGHCRLPRQVVNRALLSVQDEEDLDKLLRMSPVAFGFCINGAFYRQQNHLLNYEIGPNLKIDNENYISKCLIINDDHKINQRDDECEIVLNYLVHYNHYERLNKVIIEQKPLKSTYSRGKRGQELGELFTSNDAINLLGDNENEAFPIFLVLNKTEADSVTLCTAHFDFYTLQLSIYQHNPKDNNQPSFIYNLTDLFN